MVDVVILFVTVFVRNVIFFSRKELVAIQIQDMILLMNVRLEPAEPEIVSEVQELADGRQMIQLARVYIVVATIYIGLQQKIVITELFQT